MVPWILTALLAGTLVWAVPQAAHSRRLALRSQEIDVRLQAATARFAEAANQDQDMSARLEVVREQAATLRGEAQEFSRRKTSLEKRIRRLEARLAELRSAAAAASASSSSSGSVPSPVDVPPPPQPDPVCYVNSETGETICEAY
ncbi:MAG: hypothetical protein ACRDIX_04065 [Actinomycetota bacterium]